MGNLSRGSDWNGKLKLENLRFQPYLNCKQSGFAALLVLVILVSFSLFGMEIFIKANSEHRIVKREAERLQAVMIADGGFEWVKGELAINPSWPGGVRPLGKGQLEVSVSPSADGISYWVTSRGRVGFANRNIRALLSYHEKSWRLSKYEVLNR